MNRGEIDIRHFHQALELSRADYKKENDSFTVSDIDEIKLKYSTLNLSEKWIYIRSSQTTLHIFKKIQSGPLLIMSHQICINDTLHVRCFLDEVVIPTKITSITDIRQISQLTQELDTYERDDIEIGINKAICSVRSTIEKLTACEEGKEFQGIFNQLQFILCQLENLCNIHSPGKDIRLRDPDLKVFKLQDDRFVFFSKFVSWLQDWKTFSCSGRAGKLSSQTFTSLIHTCQVIPKIVNYLTSDDCGFSYVLTGFLQNDSREKHFGVYRLMSGCDYNISMCQILESERRIKLSNILKIYRAQDSKFETSLKEFVGTFSCDMEPDNAATLPTDLSTYSSLFHQNFDFSNPWLSLLDMLYMVFASQSYIQRNLFQIPPLHYVPNACVYSLIMKAFPWSVKNLT